MSNQGLPGLTVAMAKANLCVSLLPSVVKGTLDLRYIALFVCNRNTHNVYCRRISETFAIVPVCWLGRVETGIGE